MLDVMRVVKGDAKLANSIVDLRFAPTATCAWDANTQPVTAIWFLRKVGDGSYVFSESPKSQSCRPFENDYEVPGDPLPAKWAYASNASAEEKLAYELGASVDVKNLNGPTVLIRNYFLFDDLTAAEGKPILRNPYGSGDVNVHLMGLLGLVKDSDPAAMQELSARLPELAQLPLKASYTLNGKSVSIEQAVTQTPATHEIHIAQSVRALLDPSDISWLGALLSSPTTPVMVRYAAAEALSHIHTARSLFYLSPFLNDADAELRVFAIGGLACFANGVPVIDPSQPSNGMDLNRPSAFKTDATVAHFAMGSLAISKNEAYYLDFWRGWWAANAGAVEAVN